MKNNKIIFIIGLYIAASIAVSGYLYLNPTKIYYTYIDDSYNKITDFHFSNKYFRYSVLISIVGLVLLYSFLQLFKKSESK